MSAMHSALCIGCGGGPNVLVSLYVFETEDGEEVERWLCPDCVPAAASASDADLSKAMSFEFWLDWVWQRQCRDVPIDWEWQRLGDEADAT